MSNIYNFEYGIASQMEANQLLTNQDEACFEEIRKILQNHNSLDRFGLTLLDKEELPEDQIRLETNSVADRTLIMQTIPKKTFEGNTVQTSWTLDTQKAVATCQTQCAGRKGKRHNPQHAGGGSGQ